MDLKIKLQFNKKHTFKIVQFTDLHYYIGGEKSLEVIENIHAVMKTECPELVVLTGDIVTGSGANWPTMASWEVITNVFSQYSTPYAIVFGNHDDEAQTSRKQLYDYLINCSNCLIAEEIKQTVAGVGNYILPIYNAQMEVEKLIYCLDSHAYATPEELDNYGWFDPSQIHWLSVQNNYWKEQNSDIQALCFFHIPLPEYKQAYHEGTFQIGERLEEECCPQKNTGLFAELKQQGNVLACFVGHDHNNNYLAQLEGISLAYGYYSGGNSYGDLPLNGARVIELFEGEETFKTWLRRRDGVVLYEVTLPQNLK